MGRRRPAAHLLIRETRPDAFAGLLIPPLAGHTARVQQALRDSQPFAALVERLRSGPPVWSPLGLPVVRDRANLHEFFIHHEDVRRAQPGWHVRDLPPETRAGLWRIVRLMAPLLVRGVKGTRITLQHPGRRRAVARARRLRARRHRHRRAGRDAALPQRPARRSPR